MFIFTVTPTADNKNEEYYFKECLKRDDLGTEILNRLSCNDLPVFNKSVSKIIFVRQ